jgi:prevent-host-death family protein
MAMINVHDAKTHFSRILSRVEGGEEVVIARAGKPVARIVPLGKKKKRSPGTARGRVTVRKKFFEPLPESVLKEFEN